MVDSNPSNAKVTIGDISKPYPRKITDLVAGSYPVTIQKDGYEDYKSTVTITPIRRSISAPSTSSRKPAT